MEISSYKNSILKESLKLINQSWSPTTKKLYLGIWKKFSFFCNQNKVEPIPADNNTIISFILQLSKTAPSQVNIFLAILSIVNKINDLKSPYNSELITRIAKSIEKNRKKKEKVETFPTKILTHHLLNKGKTKYNDWLKEALIIGLCLRTTWRTETLSAISTKNISFKTIDHKKIGRAHV